MFTLIGLQVPSVRAKGFATLLEYNTSVYMYNLLLSTYQQGYQQSTMPLEITQRSKSV